MQLVGSQVVYQVRLGQGRIQGGATGAGRPSPMETGAPAPKEQGRQFSSPFAECLSLGLFFLFHRRRCFGAFPPAKALFSSMTVTFQSDTVLSRQQRRPSGTKRRLYAPTAPQDLRSLPNENSGSAPGLGLVRLCQVRFRTDLVKCLTDECQFWCF